MCTLYVYLCIPYSILTTKNLVSIHHNIVDSLYPFYPSHLPSGNLYSVFCIYMFVFVWFGLFIWFLCFFYIPHMSKIIYLSFSIWLISVSIIPSGSSHVAAHSKISSFLWLNSIPVFHIFFVCASVDGHLVCFHILAMVNNAAVNIWVHVSFWINVFIFFK